MKTLYLVGGTMGVGKTTACTVLKQKLPKAVFLDGDWCWDMHPFVVNAETQAMVLDNITHTLNNFLACSQFEHVIFCWVMHRQSILDDILTRLNTENCRVLPISLTCSEAALRSRLTRDINSGLRQSDILDRSLPRLPLYASLDTIKIDTTFITAEETADTIAAL